MRFLTLQALLFVGISLSGALVNHSFTETECKAQNRKIFEENGATRERAKSLFLTCKDNRKRIFLKRQCNSVKNIYATFQLSDEIVFKEEMKIQEICEIPPDEETIPKVEINTALPTVMLVGQTGVGKSYLANAIFGQKRPKIGPFAIGDGMDAKTVHVRSREATFFGNRGEHMGLPKFRLNIVDTPGKNANMLVKL